MSTHTPAAGASYALLACGDPSQWFQFSTEHPRLGKREGKRFLRADLGLTGMEVSLNALPAGSALPYLHGHKQNEECYLFLSGEGEFQVDDEVFPVGPGSVVRVAPEGLRSLRSTGPTPLVHLVIQAKAGSLEQANTADGFLPDRLPAWC